MSAWRKYPMIPVGIAFALGIWTGEYLSASLPWLFAAAYGFSILAMLNPRWKSALLGLAVFAAAWTHHACRTSVLAPDDLRLVIGEITDEVAIRGKLADSPVVAEHEARNRAYQSSLAVLQVESLRMGRQGWQPASGLALARVSGALPEHCVAGTRIEATGVLQPPPGPVAPGLFDYRTHLRHRGIYHYLRVPSLADWKLLEPPRAPGWTVSFRRWAKATLSHGLPEEDDALRLLWAMLLGWKTGLTEEVATPFMRSGTMHLFAISGLHVAMIAGILFLLPQLFRAPRNVSGLLAIPLLWFYTAATDWQPSAIRASLMISVLIGGQVLRRPSNLLNSLFAAGLLIWLWDSRQLFHAGFQLSFLVVLSIGLLCPLLDAPLNRLLSHDPLIPDDHLSPWRKWPLAILRLAAKAVSVSGAAWLGSLPLVALYFNLLTPVSLLANVPVVLLGNLTLMSGLASLFSAAAPVLTEHFNHAAWFFMRAMMETSAWCANLPGAFFYVVAPGPAFFIFYYGALIATAAPGILTAKTRLLLVTALAIGAPLWLVWQSRTGDDQLTIIPFADGSASLAQTANRRFNLLVDCGRQDASERVLTPFLRSQGIKRLSGLLLTHGDIGQIEGAEQIRTNFAPAQIFCGPLTFRSAAYRRLLDTYSALPGLLTTLNPGDQSGPLKILHPSAQDIMEQADDAALVFRLNVGGARILMLSDLSRAGQNLLMQKAGAVDLWADILVTGVPAQSEPLADALLEAVRPKLVIVTDSLYPSSARAPRSLQQRLARHRLPVIYTRHSGAVTITARQGRWTLSTMAGERLESGRLPYWQPLPAQSDERDW